MIEQAVFTSRQTGTAAGYHLIARSRNVGDADARALAVWCPSHDALAADGRAGECFNFHPLPSGAWCLSRTMAAGAEYSGRGGVELYTQCLLVPPAILSQYANQPLALGRALLAQGHLAVLADIPPELRALELPGRASSLDRALVSDVVRECGAEYLAAVLEALVQAPQVALVVAERPHRIVAALLNCLPLACRTDCSFTTGLRVSSRRPFRLHCWPSTSDELRVARRAGWPVLQAGEDRPTRRELHTPWARFVAQTLATGDYDALSAAVAGPRVGTLQELAELPLDVWQPVATPAVAAPVPCAVRGDRPHNRPATQGPAAPMPTAAPSIPHDAADDPSRLLAQQCPQALARLEQLDDALFEAVAGKSSALTELKRLWPSVLAELGPRLVEESKSQYLRHALAAWRHCNEGDGNSDPARAVAVLEILMVLLQDHGRGAPPAS